MSSQNAVYMPDCSCVIFQLVAFILIGVAVYGRASAIVTNLPIIGGILACGVFLILISILGLIGAIKHHQVLLFFVSLHIHVMLKEHYHLGTHFKLGIVYNLIYSHTCSDKEETAPYSVINSKVFVELGHH
jgi:hypothetical protein